MILTVCPNPSVDKFVELSGLVPGGVNRSRGEKAFPGGKGVHVAIALGELGVPTALAGIWGGPTGRWIQDECVKHGFRCMGPETAGGWTRTCLTLITGPDQGETEILEQGPLVSAADLDALFEAVKVNLEKANALCVSGSWPAGSPDDVYRRLKDLADSAGVPLWIDASGTRLQQAVDVKPWGVHVNRSEAESLLGRIQNLAGAARNLLSDCSVAAVTDGADGLYLAQGDKVLHAVCRLDHVISAVGSGDCLLAGIIASASEGGDTEEMAITGTACGAANCLRPDLGMFYSEDVEKLKRKVVCREVL